jgi:Ser/Thr protein kinase RdoA (MazF antagonist)
MVVKTDFSKEDFSEILSNYELGEFQAAIPFSKGSVQTNLLLETGKGKFAFRYYENRSEGSVLFESNLIRYLKDKNYPCPAPFPNKRGKFVGIYHSKPYVIFEFMEGQHVENPDETQKKQLVEKVAELQNLTKNYRARYKEYRWNYSVELCRELGRKAAAELNTVAATEKLKWHEGELLKLKLPESLPKGVCHCDFHFSNVLFKDNRFNALLDFDDANYTFLTFDLVGLIESWAWRYDKDKVLNFTEAKKIVAEYMKHRDLNPNEKLHLFDVYKLSILIDCIWYFAGGDAEDFYEKRKIEFLDSVGRQEFYKKLFQS